jgi:hypothetical protein
MNISVCERKLMLLKLARICGAFKFKRELQLGVVGCGAESHQSPRRNEPEPEPDQ